MSTYNYIAVEHEDGIYLCTFNRPDRLNAFHEPMREEMRQFMKAVREDPAARAIILTGKGRGFCAGEDVNEMPDRSSDDYTTRDFRALARNIHNFIDDLEDIELPVIAAINGVCAGGGLEIALSCDFRVVAEGAKLGLPEMRVGLVPGSGGCSRLVKAVGFLRAKEIVLRGKMFDAQTADRYGLASEVVPDDQVVERAKALARELAQWSPAAVGLAKVIVKNCANTDLETSRNLERLGNSVLMKTPEHGEAVSAFLEKRPPSFAMKNSS